MQKTELDFEKKEKVTVIAMPRPPEIKNASLR